MVLCWDDERCPTIGSEIKVSDDDADDGWVTTNAREGDDIPDRKALTTKGWEFVARDGTTKSNTDRANTTSLLELSLLLDWNDIVLIAGLEWAER
jgi:DNA-binding PadR family transcriptional regulator